MQMETIVPPHTHKIDLLQFLRGGCIIDGKRLNCHWGHQRIMNCTLYFLLPPDFRFSFINPFVVIPKNLCNRCHHQYHLLANPNPVIATVVVEVVVHWHYDVDFEW